MKTKYFKSGNLKHFISKALKSMYLKNLFFYVLIKVESN